MSTKAKSFWLAILFIVVIGFTLFIWPTRYRYDHTTIRDERILVRIDRFTGMPEALTHLGWERLEDEREAVNEPKKKSSGRSLLDDLEAEYGIPNKTTKENTQSNQTTPLPKDITTTKNDKIPPKPLDSTGLPYNKTNSNYIPGISDLPDINKQTPRQTVKPSGLYAGTGGGHWIESVSSNGEIIKLEDGSIWQVSPSDRIDTTLWLALSSIVVVDTNDIMYPYRLINKDDNETAKAKLLSQ